MPASRHSPEAMSDHSNMAGLYSDDAQSSHLQPESRGASWEVANLRVRQFNCEGRTRPGSLGKVRRSPLFALSKVCFFGLLVKVITALTMPRSTPGEFVESVPSAGDTPTPTTR